MEAGIKLIAEQRKRHLAAGYTDVHDDEHGDGVLYKIAGALLAKDTDCYFEYLVKPKDSVWMNKLLGKQRDRVDALVEAGAFIVAEINRIQRDQALGGE